MVLLEADFSRAAQQGETFRFVSTFRVEQQDVASTRGTPRVQQQSRNAHEGHAISAASSTVNSFCERIAPYIRLPPSGGHRIQPARSSVRLRTQSGRIVAITPIAGKGAFCEPSTTAFFGVGWDQLASSAGPPSCDHGKSWWAGATKRRLSHPTVYATPTRRWAGP